MIVIRGTPDRQSDAFPTLPPALRGGVLALGNFDGVHAGHQAVIAAAVAHARASGAPALVATFDPHPSRHFRPDAPPFALNRPDQKVEILGRLGLDAVIVIPFDAALAALPAEAFMDRWLRGRFGLSHVVTGQDFSFGKGRSGDSGTLASAHDRLGFSATAVVPVGDAGAIVSSTRIRAALRDGAVRDATALMTRPFTIRGEVVHGDKRGRTIGVPTANMLLGDYVRPRYGVYAVRARLADGSVVDGVANLGIRPMFDPPRELLETWLPDWSGDLYGQMIEIALIDWVREERRLDGLAALKAQIADDAALARRLLSD